MVMDGIRRDAQRIKKAVGGGVASAADWEDRAETVFADLVALGEDLLAMQRAEWEATRDALERIKIAEIYQDPAGLVVQAGQILRSAIDQLKRNLKKKKK